MLKALDQERATRPQKIQKVVKREDSKNNKVGDVTANSGTAKGGFTVVRFNPKAAPTQIQGANLNSAVGPVKLKRVKLRSVKDDNSEKGPLSNDELGDQTLSALGK